ncbi:MAG: zinc ribbon domain-containing protein [Oscillospiraceae bacterium]|nr:zinc ribbon domain-containing protein [Oscillospiraceae bacterium]
MPFYDLYCPACDKEHNIRATMAEKATRQIPCPECGSTELETLYNAAPAYIKSAAQVPCPSSSTCGNAGCRHAS